MARDEGLKQGDLEYNYWKAQPNVSEYMARLAEGAEPIPNPVGAAPGSWLKVNNTIIVSLPGVPKEMKEMFTLHVEPRLKEIAPKIEVVECGITIRGVPESGLAPELKRIAREYPRAYIKSHPKGHELEEPVLELQVLVSAETRDKAESVALEILRRIEEVARKLGGRIISEASCK
jgi:molybdopterin-biosynthesis enzyme MoeA-like protein